MCNYSCLDIFDTNIYVYISKMNTVPKMVLLLVPFYEISDKQVPNEIAKRITVSFCSIDHFFPERQPMNQASLIDHQ